MIRSPLFPACLVILLSSVPLSTSRVADGAGAAARSEAPKAVVRVDTRVELAAVLCRLAGFDEYQASGIPAYDRAVESHFRRFESHPSIALMRRLRKDRGIAYSATVELALAAEPVTWKPRMPMDPWPASMGTAFDPKSAAAFLKAAARFEKDTGAARFFAGQAAIYGEVEKYLSSTLLGWLDLAWYERQFGPRKNATFTIVPALLNGPNSYGPHLDLPAGRVEIYAVLATPRFGENEPISYPLDIVRSFTVHELAHSYVNPWVDKHATRLETSGRALYAQVADRMSANAYGSWTIMLYESLVRATTLRYFADHGEAVPYKRSLADDRSKAFLWTAELAEAIKVEPANGSVFAGAEPRVFAFFDTWGQNAASKIEEARRAIEDAERAERAKGPQIVGLIPADGDASVDPALDHVEIRFDRAMARTASVLGSDIPEVAGRPSWDAARRTFRIPVRLKPGTRYRLFLNSDVDKGFASETGEPLYQFVWTFKTR